MTQRVLRSELNRLGPPLGAAGIDLAHAYLVGGVVRDALLGRPSLDLDLIVTDDPASVARILSRHLHAPVFALSVRHGAWRVVVGGPTRSVIDVSPVTGGSVGADLRRRDFTANALAVRFSDGALIDELDGVSAISDGRLSAASATAFTSDPLRLVRLARFAAELGFAADAETVRLAVDAAPQVGEAAGERSAAELHRILAADVRRGLELLDRTGVGAHLVPGRHRPLLDAAPAILALGATAAGSSLPDDLQPELDRRLDGTTDLRAALRLAALLGEGADPGEAASRLRVSRAVRTAIVRSRLAVAGGPPPASAPDLLRWLGAARPSGLGSLALAVAGDPALADRALLAVRLSMRRPPLVTGTDLRELLGVEAGPRLGEILGTLGDEQALGRITTRSAALDVARRLVSS